MSLEGVGGGGVEVPYGGQIATHRHISSHLFFPSVTFRRTTFDIKPPFAFERTVALMLFDSLDWRAHSTARRVAGAAAVGAQLADAPPRVNEHVARDFAVVNLHVSCHSLPQNNKLRVIHT